jgi:hypothetical protein
MADILGRGRRREDARAVKGGQAGRWAGVVGRGERGRGDDKEEDEKKQTTRRRRHHGRFGQEQRRGEIAAAAAAAAAAVVVVVEEEEEEEEAECRRERVSVESINACLHLPLTLLPLRP